jgi:acyl-CoA hydrolase
MSNSCLFTFVNVDDELQHQPVPLVYPANYGEDARYLAAHRSCQDLRKHRQLI